MTKKVKNIIIILTILVLTSGIILFNVLHENKTEAVNLEIPLNIDKLNDVQSENLYKFGKVWGFVKYYNPQVTAQDIDMDSEAMKMVEVLYKARSSKEGNRKILEWVKSIGEREALQDVEDSAEGIKWIQDTKIYGKELSAELSYIYRYKRDGKNKYVKPILKTQNSEFIEEPFEDMNYEDDRMRVLALYRYWNAVEYFFPYKHLTDKKWDDVLKEYLPEVITAENYDDYFEVIFKLTKEVCDDHALLYKEGEKYTFLTDGKERVLPVMFDSILNGNIHIKEIAVEGEESGLMVGDIVRSIDGESVEVILDRLQGILHKNNDNHILRSTMSYLRYTNKDKVILSVEREGKSLDIEVPSYSDILHFNEDKSSNKWIEDDIMYINPENLEKFEINKIMNQSMGKASGIIIDLRKYPKENIIVGVGGRIYDKERVFVKHKVPDYVNPGRYIVKEDKMRQSGAKRFTGKVILLIDKDSASHPEYTAMGLREAPNAVVIGTRTNGTDGNKSFIKLPGNMTATFSGVGIYNPDGSETQRVGLEPDIEVVKTIESIREGRDLLIEKAIELIRE